MATKRASGARKAPARSSKPAAAKAPAAAAAPAASAGTGSNVELVVVAKGSRMFGDASGRRRHVASGEHFTVDANTARHLLEDPEAFALAGGAPAPAVESASGPVTVADLPDGAKIAKPEDGTSSDASSDAATSPADAAAAASAGGEDQGGTSTPADDPEATASDEAGTPPAEAIDAAPGATVLS